MPLPSFLGSRKYIDKPFWILFIALIVVAIIALFSASSTLVYQSPEHPLSPILKQIMCIIVGVGCAYVVQLLPVEWVRRSGYVLLGLVWLCLIVMMIPGNPFVVSHNDAARWCKLFGIEFQPSEFAKLGLVIVVADQLARIKNDEDMKKKFFITLGITAAVCLPIMKENMSTAMLMAIVVFLLWVLAHISCKYLSITALGTILAGVLFYLIIEFGFIRPEKKLPEFFKRAETQVKRVDSVLQKLRQPEAEFKLNDHNYQESLAKVAVMRGGKTPFGVFPGNSQERDFLPLAFADYIFAIIVEETGLVGACALILLYLVILFRACYASSKYEDYDSMLLTMGIALMITCQALISMSVSVGIGPVTGQPLPMISHGGTGVIITSIYFGIMMGVARWQNELKEGFQKSVQESEEEFPQINNEE